MAIDKTFRAGWLDHRRRGTLQSAIDFAKGALIGTLVIAALWVLV